MVRPPLLRPAALPLQVSRITLVIFRLLKPIVAVYLLDKFDIAQRHERRRHCLGTEKQSPPQIAYPNHWDSLGVQPEPVPSRHGHSGELRIQPVATGTAREPESWQCCGSRFFNFNHTHLAQNTGHASLA
ncbi:uncharacterized protein LMH87_009011 [Akanthomyces muscarius]|uniref:Uncharacterized protein n=1 Tax=Akanthomyces muscarius TaxID=2231603 RepID=A0A9W8QIC0_AKAMU|nr:uncharacterized protein LMH87_009011 [Akanthomyces muscarius]KAJ4158488.1 hypothetical protein LMH87_009011 [Akanthomyces muscarius]